MTILISKFSDSVTLNKIPVGIRKKLNKLKIFEEDYLKNKCELEKLGYNNQEINKIILRKFYKM